MLLYNYRTCSWLIKIKKKSKAYSILIGTREKLSVKIMKACNCTKEIASEEIPKMLIQ